MEIWDQLMDTFVLGSFIFFLGKLTYVCYLSFALADVYVSMKKKLAYIIFAAFASALIIDISSIFHIENLFMIHSLSLLIDLISFPLFFKEKRLLLYCSFSVVALITEPFVFVTYALANYFALPFDPIMTIGGWGFVFVLKWIFVDKLKINHGMKVIFENKRTAWLAMILLIIISAVQQVLSEYMHGFERQFATLAGIITFVVVVGYALYVFNKRQMELKEMIIIQQEKYVQSLEDLQKDLRTIQHDYKNVLAGLVYQLEAGEVKEAQLYLENVVGTFDEGIKERIMQNTHLGNIRQLALKSLMLMKMTEYEQRGIAVHLEVARPVTRVNMDAQQLIRCLGILLDNAAEEVAAQIEKKFQVLISATDQECTFIIKNPCQRYLPPVKELERHGFSTKGADRGLGLATYEEIIGQYQHILRATKTEKGEFIQILTIMNQGGAFG